MRADVGVRVLRPTDLREARDAVRDTPGALLFRGAGTKQDWGTAPESTDAVIDTAGLDQLVDHSAGDMVAIVGAGMPLSRLQEALAPAGQWLAIDPPLAADGATVGGVFAANDAGPRRLRYGTLRDLAIGVTVVLADGEVARSGGRVVKNVAGFDLVRLLCGSLGTLGLVTEVIVRLHPLPETSLTLRIPADPALATDFALALAHSVVEPSAMDAAEGGLWVRLEGRAAGVNAQADAVAVLAGDLGAGCQRLDGDDEAAAWRRLREAHAGQPGETVARAAALPDRGAAVTVALDAAAGAAGVRAELASHAALGLHTARLTAENPVACAAAVADWRRRVSALGGTVVLRRGPHDLDAWLDPEVTPLSALTLMRAVKAQLDPDRRCAPGRFVGGI